MAQYNTLLVAHIKPNRPMRLRKRTADHTEGVMIDPETLRAARSLLGWSQADLAERSGVNINTIKSFEKRDRKGSKRVRSNPTRTTLIAWRTAFANAGVIFLDEDDAYGPGVRLKKKRR